MFSSNRAVAAVRDFAAYCCYESSDATTGDGGRLTNQEQQDQQRFSRCEKHPPPHDNTRTERGHRGALMNSFTLTRPAGEERGAEPSL